MPRIWTGGQDEDLPGEVLVRLYIYISSLDAMLTKASCHYKKESAPSNSAILLVWWESRSEK